MDAFKYFAFISYSHKDKKEAKELYRRLTYYRLPVGLAGEVEKKEGRKLPKKLSPIFLDDEEMAKSSVQAAMTDGLSRSKYLIVVCSPNSAKSEYCNSEVQQFIAMGRGDKIIPYIIEGTPCSGNPATECYPEAMRDPDRLGADVVHMQPPGVNRVPDQGEHCLPRPDLFRIWIFFIQVVCCPLRSVPVGGDQFEEFHNDGAGDFIYGKIVKLTVFLPHPAFVHQFIPVWARTAAPDSVLGHLSMGCLHADGGFFTLTAGRPVPHEVQQPVHLVIELLFTFPGAPDLDAVLNEPLDQERGFILFSAQPVEHENQKDVELLLLRHLPDFDDRVTLGGGHLVSGDAFLHALSYKDPVVFPADELFAFPALHGDIVLLIYLSPRRYSVQTHDSFHFHRSLPVRKPSVEAGRFPSGFPGHALFGRTSSRDSRSVMYIHGRPVQSVACVFHFQGSLAHRPAA